jgi:hypothetical protein
VVEGEHDLIDFDELRGRDTPEDGRSARGHFFV